MDLSWQDVVKTLVADLKIDFKMDQRILAKTTYYCLILHD